MFGIISEWHGQAVGVSVRSSRTVWGGGVSAWNIMCCVMVLQQNSLQNTRRLLLILVCRYVVCKCKIETNAICWFGCEQNQWELFLATLRNNNYYYFSNRLLSTRYFFVLFFSSIICLCRVLERSRIVMKHSCIVRCHLSCLRVPFFFFHICFWNSYHFFAQQEIASKTRISKYHKRRTLLSLLLWAVCILHSTPHGSLPMTLRSEFQMFLWIFSAIRSKHRYTSNVKCNTYQSCYSLWRQMRLLIPRALLYKPSTFQLPLLWRYTFHAKIAMAVLSFVISPTSVRPSSTTIGGVKAFARSRHTADINPQPVNVPVMPQHLLKHFAR